jgi:integrase
VAGSVKFPISVRRGSCQVKIYRDQRPYGVYFRVIYYLGGKRQRLVFGSLGAAKAEAEAKAAQLARGDLDASQMTGRDRLIYGRSLEAIRILNLPLDAAAHDYASARKALGSVPLADAVTFFIRHHGGTIQRLAVAEGVDAFLKDKTEQGLSKVYLDDLRYRLRSFEKSFHCDLNHLTHEDVRLFLSAQKLSPRSYNNFLRTLKTFFGYAQSRKWLAKQVDLLEGLAKRREIAKPVAIFTPGELQKLLDACKPDLAACLALTAFAGVRMEEILRLQWEDIYRRPGYVEVEAQKAKTARRRLVPMASNLCQWLDLADKQSGPLWPHSKAYLFESIPRAAFSAGISWKRNALRHSFISYRLAETQNKHQVAEEAGNSPAMIDRHYRELVTPAEGQLWFEIVPVQTGKISPFQQSAA